MNKKIILISTVLLISNLGFAYDIATIRTLKSSTSKNIVYDITQDISEKLVAKGLDKDVAHVLSAKVFNIDTYRANIMIQNLQLACPSLSKEDISSYIVTKALYKESINLASYDTLVGMLQSKKGINLDADMLQTLRSVSRKNRSLEIAV